MASSADSWGKRDPTDDSENKPIPKKHKANSDEKEETVQGLDDFLQAVYACKKTLFASNLRHGTDMSDLINFFKDVALVVSVRLTLNNKTKRMPCGFVEFSCATAAKKAQEKKDGKYLRGHKITLVVAAEIAPYPPRPKYCLEYKVCKDYHLVRERCLTNEAEVVDGLDVTPTFIEATAARKRTLFIAHLSPQTKRIHHIISFFRHVGPVVSVRLIVNHEGRHVGCGFVEFPSPFGAKEALEKMNGEFLHGSRIFLDVAKTAPFSLRPKFNLVDKLCYEDYLLRESLLIEEDEAFDRLYETPDFVEAVAVRKKTLFFCDLSAETNISDIINFFKDVGQVVHVRLMVSRKGERRGYGYVQFASINEAKKALEKKDGEYLHDCKICLEMPTRLPHFEEPPMYCIDHKVWYEDYLRGESRLIEEDEAGEGLDETPDFAEEVAVTKKTLFMANFYLKWKIPSIIDFFKDVGEVVSVRFTVSRKCKRLGCGFVEFASAKEAKKALKEKNGARGFCGRCIYLDVVERAPYPLRPKYSLAEKLWYEDYLRRESEEDDLEIVPNQRGVFVGKRITFSDND